MMRSMLVALAALFVIPLDARAQEPRRDPDRITLDEIQTLPDARDAFDIVRLLRPAFLVERRTGSAGQSRPGQLVVWVNGAERGGVDALRTIPAHAVLEIRRLSQADATTRYGKDQNGVLLVRVGALDSPPPPEER